jgi:uncharacterized protein (TIGR02231 family)
MQQLKNLVSASALLILTVLSFGQKRDTVYTSANLTKATVYYGFGADLEHSCSAHLTSGMQEVIINNVSLAPDINTLQIACPENVTILSYKHRIFYQTPTINTDPAIKKSLDTIKLLEKNIADLSNESYINEDVIQRTSELIKNNFTTPDKKNISSVELMKLTTFYTDRITQLKQKNYELKKKIDDFNEKINDIQNRITQKEQQQQQAVSPKAIGQFILQVMAKNASITDFNLNYFTNNAGWAPTYDIRVKSIDNSLKIVYKAMVTQTTVLNWNGVKLNLSTSNPNQGNTIPLLNPYFVQLYAPAIYNKYAYAVPAATNLKTEDVEVVMYDAAKKDTKNIMQDDGVANFTALKESQLNTNFEIDLPYTIPSDGVAYCVNIKEEKLTATYQHLAIPKLDKDAFLMAQLNRWDSLSLLPGDANIIMDNVYIGKSFLDPNTTDDTLNLSLGRDKRISIDRKLVKELKTVKRNDSKTEVFTYEITIKNNKKQSIELLLKDQFPISKVKDIEVILLENGDATVDSETGMLDWKLNLTPGESKKVRFSYQLKYPKGVVVY